MSQETHESQYTVEDREECVWVRTRPESLISFKETLFMEKKRGITEQHPYGSCWNSSLGFILPWCPFPLEKHMNHNSSHNPPRIPS